MAATSSFPGSSNSSGRLQKLLQNLTTNPLSIFTFEYCTLAFEFRHITIDIGIEPVEITAFLQLFHADPPRPIRSMF